MTIQNHKLIQSRHTKFWLVVCLIALFIFWALSPMLMPFVASIAIAYFLNPGVNWVTRQGHSRTTGTIAMLGAFLLAVITTILIIVPLIVDQIDALIKAAPEYSNQIRNNYIPRITAYIEQLSPESVSSLRSAAGDQAGAAVNWFTGLARKLLSNGVALVDMLSLAIITPIIAFYLLRDWDDLVAIIDKNLPRKNYNTIKQKLAEIDNTLAGFLRGQSLVCLCLGAMYGIGLSLTGLDYGFSIGAISGILSFIPYAGTGFGLITSTMLAMIQWGDFSSLIPVLIVFGIGQVVESYFLTPRLVGERVGLHPVWILFALFAGGSLLGFTGVLIAVPTAAVLGVLIRYGMECYRKSPYFIGASDEP